LLFATQVGEKTGGYAVVFDPLDGSSNIDANISGSLKRHLPCNNLIG